MKRAVPNPLKRSSLVLTQTFVIDARGFPPLWGVALAGDLAVGAHVSLMFGAFYPVSRAKQSSSEVELYAGLAFARFGISLHQSLGNLELGGSLTGGPALVWVHADASAPWLGGDAHTVSALSSFGLQACYPARSRVFALASGRAGLLLPAARFVLPGEATPELGPLLFEANIGVGVRF